MKKKYHAHLSTLPDTQPHNKCLPFSQLHIGSDRTALGGGKRKTCPFQNLNSSLSSRDSSAIQGSPWKSQARLGLGRLARCGRGWRGGRGHWAGPSVGGAACRASGEAGLGGHCSGPSSSIPDKVITMLSLVLGEKGEDQTSSVPQPQTPQTPTRLCTHTPTHSHELSHLHILTHTCTQAHTHSPGHGVPRPRPHPTTQPTFSTVSPWLGMAVKGEERVYLGRHPRPPPG